MLKEILGYLRKFNSEEYRMGEDIKSFAINVCANIIVEGLEDNDELRKAVKNKLGMR